MRLGISAAGEISTSGSTRCATLEESCADGSALRAPFRGSASLTFSGAPDPRRSHQPSRRHPPLLENEAGGGRTPRSDLKLGTTDGSLTAAVMDTHPRMSRQEEARAGDFPVEEIRCSFGTFLRLRSHSRRTCARREICRYL